MKTVVLNKKIDGAYSNADGYTLFCILEPSFANNERVEISMLGFPLMSSSFFNSSFGELIQKYGYEKFKSSLRFTNITRQQANQIKSYVGLYVC